MRRVDKNLTRNQLGDLVGFFDSGLVGFGLIQVGPKFIIGAKIWSDSTRSGRNLIGSRVVGSGGGRLVTGGCVGLSGLPGFLDSLTCHN